MSSTELQRRIGISKRELQYWRETHLVRCAHRNKRGWEYNNSEALRAAIVADLRKGGIGTKRLRRLKLRRIEGPYLIVNAHSLKAHWCSSIEDSLACAASCYGPVVIVLVQDLERRLSRAV